MKILESIKNKFKHDKKLFLIVIALLISIIAFIIPFWIKTTTDTALSVLSTSFTAIAGVTSIFTLYIAIMLFQRFGIESKFIEKKVDAVLKLADLLKGKMIRMKYEGSGTFFFHPKRLYIDIDEKEIPTIREFENTGIAYISEADYKSFFNPIFELTIFPWLPDEISKHIKFFDIVASLNPEEIKNKNYSIVSFESKANEDILFPYPELTVKEFLQHFSDLVSSIESWLMDNCDIKIDLKLDEPNIFKS